MNDRSAGRLLVLCGVVAIVGIVWHNMDIVGDGFWYIASGRWLLAHGVPHADPFSYASDGTKWIIANPGACALFAFVADHLGLHALMVLCTVVEAGAIALVWSRSARTTPARLVLLPWALYVVRVDADDLSVRGQVFGDLGFVLLLGALARLRDGKRVHPGLFVLGGAVWVNLHPSFLMLLVLPLGAAAALMLEPYEGRPEIRRFLVIVPLSLLGGMATVYGPRYLAATVRLASTSTNDDFDLFRSPDLHDPAWLAAPLLGLTLLVVRHVRGEARGRISEQALLLAFVTAACLSRRYATQLVVVEMAILGPLLDGVRWPSRPTHLRAAALLGSAAAAVAGTVWMTQGNDPLKNVPAAAAEAARAATGDGRRASHVMNPLHWGGYLAYAWGGHPKYFIDGRDQVALFGNGVYEDAVSLRRGLPTYDAYAELLDAYEVGVVLEERGFPLDFALRSSPAWRLIHEDRLAVVYVRTR